MFVESKKYVKYSKQPRIFNHVGRQQGFDWSRTFLKPLIGSKIQNMDVPVIILNVTRNRKICWSETSFFRNWYARDQMFRCNWATVRFWVAGWYWWFLLNSRRLNMKYESRWASLPNSEVEHHPHRREFYSWPYLVTSLDLDAQYRNCQLQFPVFFHTLQFAPLLISLLDGFNWLAQSYENFPESVVL